MVAVGELAALVMVGFESLWRFVLQAVVQYLEAALRESHLETKEALVLSLMHPQATCPEFHEQVGGAVAQALLLFFSSIRWSLFFC